MYMTQEQKQTQAREDAEYCKNARQRARQRFYKELKNMPEAPKTLPFRTITESEYLKINNAINAATANLPKWKAAKLGKSIFFDMLSEFVQMRTINPKTDSTRAIVVSEPDKFGGDGYFEQVPLSGGIDIDVFTKQPILKYSQGIYSLTKPVKDFVIVIPDIPDTEKPELSPIDELLAMFD